MRKFLAVMLAAAMVSGLSFFAGAQARQTTATLKISCMSDGTIKIDSDAAPR